MLRVSNSDNYSIKKAYFFIKSYKARLLLLLNRRKFWFSKKFGFPIIDQFASLEMF